MAQVTVFISSCSRSSRSVKQFLDSKKVAFAEIDTSGENSSWLQVMFLLTKGRSTLPQIFINGQYTGDWEAIQSLDSNGRLNDLLMQAPPDNLSFPPKLKKPSGNELLEIIPQSLRQKWQQRVDQLDTLLGGTSEHPISSILLMLETPLQMVVVCTAGPGKEIYSIGAAGDKGGEGSEEKLYCQVAIEKRQTLFIDDPTKMAGLEKNEDYIKFGYGYYVGAPWAVGEIKGTIVAMEKVPGILKRQHIEIIEKERNLIEHDLKEFIATQSVGLV